jgi:demethylmacrocin O-methyltransferase
MFADRLARMAYDWRSRVRALPDTNPDYERDPVALRADRFLKRCIPIAGTLGLKLDLLAALSGTDKFGIHEYTPVYEEIMRSHRSKAISLLEMGVGGYKSMRGGESLLMWEAYFRRGRIYAIDIHDKTHLSRRRLKVFQCSQTDRKRLTDLCNEIGPFDFVIDDGSHISSHQIESFRILWPFVKDGGVYVVEDVQTSYWPKYGGGSVGSMTYYGSCVSFFKNIVDSVNLAEFLVPAGPEIGLDRTIGKVAFHHNLIMINKDLRVRRSNVALDDRDTRNDLMVSRYGM